MKNQRPKLLLALTLMFFMYNCKEKDETFPNKPDTEITDALDKVNVAPATLDQPAAVVSTPASVTASPKTAELATGLAGIEASGNVPASVTASADQVSAGLSTSEINTLSTVSTETIAAAAATGSVSPELSAILDKAQADPALASYLTTFTYPTVSGVEIKGLRTGSAEGTDKTARVLINDACVAASEAAFQEVKIRLDASKITETAKVTTAYNTYIAQIAPLQTACSAGITPVYSGYRNAAQAQANAALGSLEAAKAILGGRHAQIKALIHIGLLNFYKYLSLLEAADKQKCLALTTAATTSAQTAQTANLAKVQANYDAALAEAESLRDEAIESCHNQGGGN